jgi:hypothetical protein
VTRVCDWPGQGVPSGGSAYEVTTWADHPLPLRPTRLRRRLQPGRVLAHWATMTALRCRHPLGRDSRNGGGTASPAAPRPGPCTRPRTGRCRGRPATSHGARRRASRAHAVFRTGLRPSLTQPPCPWGRQPPAAPAGGGERGRERGREGGRDLPPGRDRMILPGITSRRPDRSVQSDETVWDDGPS